MLNRNYRTIFVLVMQIGMLGAWVDIDTLHVHTGVHRTTIAQVMNMLDAN